MIYGQTVPLPSICVFQETPIFKKGDRQALKNYRPVSLLSVPGMVCERVIAIQAEEHFENNKILQEFQFGFRKFKSTISEMLTLFDSLLEAKEKGKGYKDQRAKLEKAEALKKEEMKRYSYLFLLN